MPVDLISLAIEINLEALWMGVPVVTLVGERQVSRQGLSILSVLGLTDLITQSPEAYVAQAVKLARDIEALQQLRGTMREKMQASALMDGESFTRELEARYQEMWKCFKLRAIEIAEK
jgi:protein O-GlcNAc transferase